MQRSDVKSFNRAKLACDDAVWYAAGGALTDA